MKLLVTMFQDEDGMYVTECPSIPGCVSQGRTEEEAEQNIREAIKECLAVRAERGMPLSPSPTKLGCWFGAALRPPQRRSLSYLATGLNLAKWLGSDCTPVSPPTTSRRYPNLL